MKIFDFHTDILTEKADALGMIRKYPEKGVRAVCALFRGERSAGEIFALARAFVGAETGFPLSFEDAGYLADLGEARLEEFFGFRPLAVSLTWNGENELGFGCSENKGLKAEGKRIVRLLSERGIAVDLSHLSEAGARDVLEETGAVVATHCCFSEVTPHPRNISADIAGEIVRRGGVVGLTLVGDFLARDGKATSDDAVRHIDWFVSRFGYRSLCLGTDFYGTKNLPFDLQNYENLSVLVEKLRKIGYNDRYIQAIFFRNLERYAEERQFLWTHPFTQTP